MGRQTKNSSGQSPNKTQPTLDQGFLQPKEKDKNEETVKKTSLAAEAKAKLSQTKTVEEKFEWLAGCLDKMETKIHQNTQNVTKVQKEIEDEENGVHQIIRKQAKELADTATLLQEQLVTERETREKLQNQVERSTREISILKGIIQKQHNQLNTIHSRQVDAMARSMEDNLIISGVKEKPDEVLIDVVLDFLFDQMNIEARYDDIYTVYRMGPYVQGQTRPRPIILKSGYDLRQYILGNKSALQGTSYFVATQVPEALLADKKAVNYQIKLIKERNQTLEENEKIGFKVRNKKLYVNGHQVAQKVTTPAPIELFVNDEEQEKMDKLKLYYSDLKSHKFSQFQAVAVKTNNTEDAIRAYRKVKQLHPSADHIMMAYTIQAKIGLQDDGEHNGAIRIHATLQERKLNNIIAFVIRRYGGVHIGAARFECITEVVNDVLDTMQLKTRLDKLPEGLIQGDEVEETASNQPTRKPSHTSTPNRRRSPADPDHRPKFQFTTDTAANSNLELHTSQQTDV